MNKGELGKIISRVFALILFLPTINLIISTPMLFSQGTYVAVMYGTNITVHIILAFIFWMKAKAIGGFLVGENKKQKIDFPAYHQIMHLVFITFGLWLAGKAIPDISNIAAYIISDGIIAGRKLQSFDSFEYAVRIALHIGLGAFLIFGSDGFRKMLVKLRNAGANK
jgi:hypothetical protein